MPASNALRIGATNCTRSVGAITSALKEQRIPVAGLDRMVLTAQQAVSDIVRWRREHQPGGPNAGSVFVNPPGDSAGRLVEEAGLKGLRMGTAQVSPKHANFIQADQGGSADDVLRLIGHVRSVVAGATGVTLRTEVRLIGFPETEPGPGADTVTREGAR